MAISPAEIRAIQLNTVRRGGYDQREVEAFRTAAADALEAALQESTAMEARARAAVARLQEVSQQAAPPAEASGETQAPAAGVTPTATPPATAESEDDVKSRIVVVDEAETISRALLLAQRTADTTVAAAEQDATRRRESADAEAAEIVEAARVESRRAGESERVKVEGEVQALLARRDFLESDVDHLEQFLQAQRERIVEVAAELGDLTSRVANGLAPMRRPQLSASDHSGEPDQSDVTEPTIAGDDDDDVDVSSLIDETQAQADAEGVDDHERR